MKIISVVGARPNFMKISPLIHEINIYNDQNKEEGIEHILVHTNQHYDKRLSEKFFNELNIPRPDINLGIGSGTHADQVGRTMIEFEKVLKIHEPDWVIVVGDVNATIACSITAKKEQIKCCHIEAGLRSGDMSMPEEINRIVTDRLSDLLLTPDKLSHNNLRKEGIAEEKIKFVGNIMIDTLDANLKQAKNIDIQELVQSNTLNSENIINNLNIQPDAYVLLTMHRPSNVDIKEVLESIVFFLIKDVVNEMPLIWPIHPRTMKQLKTYNLWNIVYNHPNLILLNPVGYHEMLRLNMDARLMITDSGGLQEECCVLGIPCLTLRWNTERPITLKEYGGASVLVGNNIDRLRMEFNNQLNSKAKPTRPALWDGHTAKRCLKEILNYQS